MRLFLVVFTSTYLYVSLSVSFVCGDEAADKANLLAKEREGLIKCQKEANLPESYVDDIYTRRIVPADSGCLVKCTFEHLGWIVDDKVAMGNFLAGLRLLYHESEDHSKTVLTYFAECMATSPEEICDKARYELDCVMKKTAKAGVPVHSEQTKGG